MRSCCAGSAEKYIGQGQGQGQGQCEYQRSSTNMHNAELFVWVDLAALACRSYSGTSLTAALKVQPLTPHSVLTSVRDSISAGTSIAVDLDLIVNSSVRKILICEDPDPGPDPGPDPHPDPDPECHLRSTCARCHRQRYDVDVVLTTFDGTLWETMRLMQTTDLFLGMHGAGFTNTMFLPKVGALRCIQTSLQVSLEGSSSRRLVVQTLGSP